MEIKIYIIETAEVISWPSFIQARCKAFDITYQELDDVLLL